MDDDKEPPVIYKGEIVSLIHERPWVQTPSCHDLLKSTGNEIPRSRLHHYVNAEGREDIQLMHSHEPDHGLAGI
ncbi:MAG TPA: hypothetical protein VLC46_18260 [Thermoanaerobaculia bacterium]|jgi:hypothetical protein|nr:hypothetical protein [Thermoanaerobaculia bacterium]